MKKPIRITFEVPNAGLVQATIVDQREMPWNRAVEFGVHVEVLSQANEISKRNIVVTFGKSLFIDCRSDRDVEIVLRREMPRKADELLI